MLAIQRQRLGDMDSDVIELRRHVALLRASSGHTAEAITELRDLAGDLGEAHPARVEIVEILQLLEGR